MIANTMTQGSSPTASVASGAASGAAMGSLTGPQGALIGAGIGAGTQVLSGLLSSRAAKKRQQRDIQAQSFQNISRIEQETAAQKNQALSNIMGALRSAFLG